MKSNLICKFVYTIACSVLVAGTALAQPKPDCVTLRKAFRVSTLGAHVGVSPSGEVNQVIAGTLPDNFDGVLAAPGNYGSVTVFRKKGKSPPVHEDGKSFVIHSGEVKGSLVLSQENGSWELEGDLQLAEAVVRDLERQGGEAGRSSGPVCLKSLALVLSRVGSDGVIGSLVLGFSEDRPSLTLEF